MDMYKDKIIKELPIGCTYIDTIKHILNWMKEIQYTLNSITIFPSLMHIEIKTYIDHIESINNVITEIMLS